MTEGRRRKKKEDLPTPEEAGRAEYERVAARLRLPPGRIGPAAEPGKQPAGRDGRDAASCLQLRTVEAAGSEHCWPQPTGDGAPRTPDGAAVAAGQAMEIELGLLRNGTGRTDAALRLGGVWGQAGEGGGEHGEERGAEEERETVTVTAADGSQVRAAEYEQSPAERAHRRNAVRYGTMTYDEARILGSEAAAGRRALTDHLQAAAERNGVTVVREEESGRKEKEEAEPIAWKTKTVGGRPETTVVIGPLTLPPGASGRPRVTGTDVTLLAKAVATGMAAQAEAGREADGNRPEDRQAVLVAGEIAGARIAGQAGVHGFGSRRLSGVNEAAHDVAGTPERAAGTIRLVEEVELAVARGRERGRGRETAERNRVAPVVRPGGPAGQGRQRQGRTGERSGARTDEQPARG